MILYADLLEKKAIALLNTPESIVLSPSVEPQDGNKSYLVASAGGKPRPDFYTVKLSNKTKVVCNCKGYRFAKICSHAVAVAEKNGVLLELVKGVKISHRSALTYPNGSRGHGRKGRCNRRLRTYVATPSSNNNEEDKRPFNKVWHNNEPLIVSFVKEVPIDKNQCGYCGNAFPRDGLAIIPFNIVLSHKERWEYLNRNRSSPSEPKFLKSPPNKTTTRFYCVQKACIYKRFPYFQSNLLKVPDNMLLKDSHKKLIRDELGVEV